MTLSRYKACKEGKPSLQMYVMRLWKSINETKLPERHLVRPAGIPREALLSESHITGGQIRIPFCAVGAAHVSQQAPPGAEVAWTVVALVLTGAAVNLQVFVESVALLVRLEAMIALEGSFVGVAPGVLHHLRPPGERFRAVRALVLQSLLGRGPRRLLWTPFVRFVWGKRKERKL